MPLFIFKWQVNGRSSAVHQEFGCNDRRREKAGCGVEQTDPGLFPYVGDMAEIPSDEIVDLVN